MIPDKTCSHRDVVPENPPPVSASALSPGPQVHVQYLPWGVKYIAPTLALFGAPEFQPTRMEVKSARSPAAAGTTWYLAVVSCRARKCYQYYAHIFLMLLEPHIPPIQHLNMTYWHVDMTWLWYRRQAQVRNDSASRRVPVNVS